MIEGLQSFQNVFKIPELKRRLLFTAGLLIAYRLGAHVPTPGIDGHALAQFFDQMQQGPRTNYDRELVAQGVGNTVCGLLGALPMTGVLVRTPRGWLFDRLQNTDVAVKP